MPGQKKDHQDAGHINASHNDLAIKIFFSQMFGDTKQ
jgi:hypothetical protein